MLYMINLKVKALHRLSATLSTATKALMQTERREFEPRTPPHTFYLSYQSY